MRRAIEATRPRFWGLANAVVGTIALLSVGGFVACAGSETAVPDARPSADAAAPGPGDAGCTPVAVEAMRDVPYLARGTPEGDALTRLDVYPPAGAICDRAIVIWVHGGAWSTGDKANQMASKVQFFNELGAVLVSVNYRLSSSANGVRHPDHVEDVAGAVAWVQANASALGGRADKLALLGHSAGAHLVALVVTNPRFFAARGLSAGAVTCVGSYDTEYTVAEIVARDSRYESVFGSDPAAWADASPSAQVRPGLPPFQLACRGTRGRVEQCESFGTALRGAGNQTFIIDASPLSHEEVNTEIGLPTDEVMSPRIREFLSGCGI